MNTTVKSLQALYVKNGGLLTDTYSDICGGAAVGNYTTIPDMVAACAKLNIGSGLPADFPAEDAANANKFLGFDNSGDYAALDAPSGAETYTVHASLNVETEAVTTEESIADIIAEYGEGKTCVCEFTAGDAVFHLALSFASADENVVMFYSIVSFNEVDQAAVLEGLVNEGDDYWHFRTHTLLNIPDYDTGDDAGKVLTVTSSGLAWVTPA